jgi:hypothetical protein
MDETSFVLSAIILAHRIEYKNLALLGWGSLIARTARKVCSHLNTRRLSAMVKSHAMFVVLKHDGSSWNAFPLVDWGYRNVGIARFPVTENPIYQALPRLREWERCSAVWQCEGFGPTGDSYEYESVPK